MTTALFALHEFPPAVSRPPAPELSAVGAILRVLQGQPGKLYALLDAAVRDSVPELLKTYGEPFQSLYEGKRAEELAMLVNGMDLAQAHPRRNWHRRDPPSHRWRIAGN